MDEKLMDCYEIRLDVQKIACEPTEKTADRLRAYNLLWTWAASARSQGGWDCRRDGPAVVRVEITDDEPDSTFGNPFKPFGDVSSNFEDEDNEDFDSFEV